MRFERTVTLEWMRRTPDVAVVIVGGGINGAGILRELALNGVPALLVEKNDFASGATGASSRMIHGGLRYLEYGEFRLVREALHERNRLLKNAPHCVHPLATTIPLFSRWSGLANSIRRFLRRDGEPARRGAWLVRIGLEMYRAFAGRDNPLPRYRIDSAEDARKFRPALHPEVIATATYHDAWNPRPERLCLEVMGDALEANSNCHAINYCRVAAAEGDFVEMRDEISGEAIRIRPTILVNATGAWIDVVNGQLGPPTRFMGGTKGSHLVVDHPELYDLTRGAELFYENDDGRICLFFPLHGRVLVGTTDIPVADPNTAVCEAGEYDYLTAAIRQVFPSIEIRPEHVVSRFCGVRPLPFSDGVHPGAVSRDHQCRVIAPQTRHSFPIYCLIGGKWTTFRALAEQTVDRLLPNLGRVRTADSKNVAIGGGRQHPGNAAATATWVQRAAETHGLPPATVARLFDRYGTYAEKIAAHLAQGGAEAQQLVAGHYIGELDFLTRNEAVLHFDDLLLRRTTLALYERLDASSWRRLLDVCAIALNWTLEKRNQEESRTLDLLARRHHVRIDGLDEATSEPC